MKGKIHKVKHSASLGDQYTQCGLQFHEGRIWRYRDHYNESRLPGPSNPVKYHWKHVTCKNCLRRKK